MSAVHGVCQLVRLGVQAINLVHDVSEIPKATNENGEKNLRITAAVFRALCLAENACFVGAQMEGVSTGTLETIEGWEAFTRLVAIAPLVGEGIVRGENGNLTPWQALERGFIAPIAAFNRCASDYSRLDWQRLLEIPADQRVLPVYRSEPDGDGGYDLVFDHYRPVSDQECQDGIARNAESSTFYNVIEIAAETQTLSTAASKVIQTYQNVVDQMYPPSPPVPPVAPVAPAPVIPPIHHPHPPVTPAAPAPVQISPDEIDPFEGDFLLKLSIIPQALHNDPVFKRTCLITLNPIRDPVKVHNKLYERAAIAQLIAVNGRDCFNQPATLADIEESPILKKMIEERLRFYQTEISRSIQGGFLKRPSRRMSCIADVENPYN